MALSERPKIKEVPQLVAARCNRIVTILAVSDEPQGIGKQAIECGIAWDWLKVSQANKMSEQERRLFKTAVDNTMEHILNGECVLVHCSAGLHRTGMFAYALLRKDNSRAHALKILAGIRQETHDALEEKYLSMAEEFFI